MTNDINAFVRITAYNRAGHQLLDIGFEEASYDHTCIAVQSIIEALPAMVAGDDIVVNFLHARPELSDQFDGIMPGPREAKQDDAWRSFTDAVYYGTRP